MREGYVDGFYVDSYFTSLLVAISISFLSILTQIAIGKTETSVIVKRRKKTTNEAEFSTNEFTDKTVIDVEVKEKNKN